MLPKSVTLCHWAFTTCPFASVSPSSSKGKSHPCRGGDGKCSQALTCYSDVSWTCELTPSAVLPRWSFSFLVRALVGRAFSMEGTNSSIMKGLRVFLFMACHTFTNFLLHRSVLSFLDMCLWWENCVILIWGENFCGNRTWSVLDGAVTSRGRLRGERLTGGRELVSFSSPVVSSQLTADSSCEIKHGFLGPCNGAFKW